MVVIILVFDMAYWKKVSKKILFLILSIIALYIAVKLSIFYLPFLIAFLISSIMEPVVKFVAKHTKLQRKTSAIIVLIMFSAIIIALIAFGINSFISETSNLLQSLNDYTEKIYNYVQWWINSLYYNRFKISEQVSSVLQNSAQDFLSVISEYIKSILNALLQVLTKIPTIAVYVIITLLATYFICADRLYILDQIEFHFPRNWVKRVATHIKQLGSSLGGYLKAQAILVIIAFFQVLIGLFILKYTGMNVQYPLIAAL